MQLPGQLSSFGDASICTSLDQISAFIRDRPGKTGARRRAAALGMALVSAEGADSHSHYRDAMATLDRLCQAKAEIDIAALHSQEVRTVTSQLLASAQQYVDETSIPCTEWPSTTDIAEFVLNEACQLTAAA